MKFHRIIMIISLMMVKSRFQCMPFPRHSLLYAANAGGQQAVVLLYHCPILKLFRKQA